uniref:Coat protein n=1 Tax=Maize-associated picornavirus TaxID=2057199 RepID=A0A2H5CRV7_9VIRU|nr:coat protein [Maize-associated picornavirus]
MVDNLSTDVQQETNTTYFEQRAVLAETTFPGSSLSMPSGIESEMAESHWLARTQLSKPTQISQVQWTTTQAPGTNITTFTFPEVLTSVDSVIRRTLQMYAFYKMSPVFRFQLNATQFHQGQLIISFDPFRQSISDNFTITQENSTTPIYNRFYATGLPNVKIMASESDPVELKIPYIHPKNFLSSNSENSSTYNLLGEIRVTVLNQLQVAEGTTPSLTLTTWVYAQDSSVHVPIQYHDLSVQPTSLISSIKSGISHGSNLIGNFATGNFGKGLRDGQGLIDDLGKLFGFDYPNRPLGPENNIKNVESLANARGATRSERLALDPVSGHPVDIEETTTMEEMNISKIIQMPMLINQTSFSSTQDPQSILYYIPVSPLLAARAGTYNGREIFQPSYLAYLSQFFCFWRGSIQFEFEFVATKFHSGKLLIGFIPNDNPSGLNYQSISTSTPSAVIDIQQTSKVSFSVPFQSTTALKYVNHLDDNFDETILGYLVVAVQNQLTHASNVSSSIDINLYVRAGDDFTYLVPRAPDIDFIIPAPPTSQVEPTSDVTFQTSRTGQEDNSKVAVISHGQTVSIPKPRFGETYGLIDCIRRFNPMMDQNSDQSISLPGEGEGRFTFLAVHPTLITFGKTYTQTTPFNFQASPSYLSLIGRLFSAWSGSLRYKFITNSPRTTTQSLSIYHIPDTPVRNVTFGGSLTQFSGYAASQTDLSQNTTLEIEVPFYSIYNFLLTYPTSTEAAGATPYLANHNYPYINGMLNMVTTSDISITPTIYIAAGEDFRYFYLRSPPTDTADRYKYVSTTAPNP